MTVSERIDADLKDAMRAKAADKLSVLRMLLASKECAEIEMLNAYLPAGPSPEELGSLVDEAIKETGATGKAQMGPVMKG